MSRGKTTDLPFSVGESFSTEGADSKDLLFSFSLAIFSQRSYQFLSLLPKYSFFS